MTRYAIGLGSNVGDRLGLLRGAVAELRHLGRVHVMSGLYETAPVGGPDQDPYLNAVAVLDTELDARTLLQRLQSIENEAGRQREIRWGPRTLDLDIITGDADPIVSEDLQIPHPRAKKREFVLRPLAEVWPDAIVGGGVEAGSALTAIEGQEVDKLSGSWITERRWPGLVLVTIQFAFFLAIGVGMAWDGSVTVENADAGRVLGLVLSVVGAGLAFVSSRRLGTALTAVPEPRKGEVLIETGPYALARHPIYGGVFLFILGASLSVDSSAGTLLSLALVPFFYLKSGYEERQLRMHYAGYRAYQQRVSKRLLPFVI